MRNAKPDPKGGVECEIPKILVWRYGGILEPSNPIGHVIKSEDHPDRDHQSSISPKCAPSDTGMLSYFKKPEGKDKSTKYKKDSHPKRTIIPYGYQRVFSESIWERRNPFFFIRWQKIESF
jgi:hypothetical protein